LSDILILGSGFRASDYGFNDARLREASSGGAIYEGPGCDAITIRIMIKIMIFPRGRAGRPGDPAGGAGGAAEKERRPPPGGADRAPLFCGRG
jgi:hypothetical protein